MALPRKKETYSWNDYLTWDEGDRFELIEGEAFAMSPAPNIQHQRISSNLHGELWSFFKGKPCEVFAAPTDLKLSPPEEDNFPTVLQPDIMVVCDKNHIEEQVIQGGPTLVAEILSPDTAKRDEYTKRNLYEKALVKEYWLVHPSEKYIVQYSLKDNQFAEPIYITEKEKLISIVFPELIIDTKLLFSL